MDIPSDLEMLDRLRDVIGGASEVADRAALLLVEDEFEMALEMSAALEREGYAVRIAESLQQVSDAMQFYAPEVTIVGRMFRGIDSFAMIESWRASGNRAPVLVISAMSSIADRIRGLRAGGDDYLVKPFTADELVKRVEMLRRRAMNTRASLLRVGPLTMDLFVCRVYRDARQLELLPREFSLLEYFMRHPNRIVTRAMLIADIWHFHLPPQTNVVNVHIGKLRRKVDGAGEIPMIETLRARGFILHGFVEPR